MSKNKLGNKRPNRQTKSQRLADLCQELMGHVKKLGESQVKLYDIVLKTEAQINILASAIEVLKEKGLITDEEIKTRIEDAKIEIQNAKSDESPECSKDISGRSEESGSEDSIHTADSERESKIPPAESERTVDDTE